MKSQFSKKGSYFFFFIFLSIFWSFLNLSKETFAGDDPKPQILPVVANTPGSQGSYWRTEIQIHNPTQERKDVVLRFGDKSLEKTILPQKTIIMDPLAEMGIEQKFGPLYLDDDDCVVTARTCNLIDGLELCQGMPAYSLSDFLSANETGIIIVAKDAVDYRTNIGALTKDGGLFEMELYDGLGNLKKQITRRLEKGEYFQDNAEKLFDEILDGNGFVKFRIIEGDIFAYGSVVQNITSSHKGADGNFMPVYSFTHSDKTARNKIFFTMDIREIVLNNSSHLAEMLAQKEAYDHITYPNMDGAIETWTKEKWELFLNQISNGSSQDNLEFEQIMVIKDYDSTTQKNNTLIIADYCEDPVEDYFEPEVWCAYLGYDKVVLGLNNRELDNIISLFEQQDIKQESFEKIVPVVANTSGADNSFWKSDVQVYNPNEEDVVVTLQHKGVKKQYLIGAKKTIGIENVLEDLGFASGFGSLRLFSSADFFVGARTFNDQDGQEFSQYVRGYDKNESIKEGETGYLIGPKNYIDYRYNLGLLGIGAANLDLILRNEEGNLLEIKNITLEDDQLIQKNANEIFSSGMGGNYSIEIRVNSGSVFAYGSVVQNITSSHKGGDGDIWLAKKYGQKPDYRSGVLLFLHDEAAPIIYQYSEDFAEIVYRNGLLIAMAYPPIQMEKDEWERYFKRACDSSIEDREFEMQYLYFDPRRNVISMTDTYLGYIYGYDSEILNLTKEDFDNFLSLFLSKLYK